MTKERGVGLPPADPDDDGAADSAGDSAAGDAVWGDEEADDGEAPGSVDGPPGGVTTSAPARLPRMRLPAQPENTDR